MIQRNDYRFQLWEKFIRNTIRRQGPPSSTLEEPRLFEFKHPRDLCRISDARHECSKPLATRASEEMRTE